ncbi:sigma-70 family RNA polymerase sigma factor [Tautonia plasticadhaerens]|uniref:RNA polymerase sigma factor SigA n=1 Tax=Tautonia plasticadhaerens TaxID=2527974 RepID=A0A518H2S2_9BACT|nr:RNA polymerase sigma factor RpoD/SigA [Tautonia plasticadhaerens]QDV35149.1 RNA polymerase sigma factor SigA [Tautonia plasticadhaerens]
MIDSVRVSGRPARQDRRGPRTSSPRSSPRPSPRHSPRKEGQPSRAESRDLCSRDLGDEPLLTAEQERALAEAVARGDTEAFHRFVRANLRLVVAIAKHFRGRGLDFDDLIGEGNLGLIRAVRQFDPGVGVRFCTYASYWIKESIRRALNIDGAPIRLPSYMISLLTQWRRAEQEHLRRHGRPPTRDELAEALGLDESRRKMVEQALLTHQFLPGGSVEESMALEEAAADQERPEAPVEAQDQAGVLRGRLGRLDERELAIISRHLGLDDEMPQSLGQIAQGLGITREWARKLEIRALQKLGDRLEGPLLPAPRALAGSAP